MVSYSKSQPKQFNTTTAGLAVLKQELKETGILNFIDRESPKNSGYPVSEIITSCIVKNVLDIPTFTEAAEEIKELPEFPSKAYRTTLSRNIRRVGNINQYNMPLSFFGTYFINKFGILGKELRIVVDGTTIEVSQGSKYTGASWVFDNAQNKLVWGFEITIIAITGNGFYLPVHFEFGNMSKEDLHSRFLVIRMLTGANTVLFDGGYVCDEFFENLTQSNFEFYTKIPVNWWFNNGTNEQVKDLKKQVSFSKKNKYYTIKAYRVKDDKLTKIAYSLCFKENDPRVLLTNNLNENISKIAFEEFFKRWDIETCNDELKANFCFEKLPIKDKAGITGYLLTCLLALNLMTLIKFKHRKRLGKLFNKGFGIIIRWFIKVKAKWNSYSKLSKLTGFCKNFRFKWFFEEYGLT